MDSVDQRAAHSRRAWVGDGVRALNVPEVTLSDYSPTSVGNMKRVDSVVDWLQERGTRLDDKLATRTRHRTVLGAPAANSVIDNVQKGFWELYRFTSRTGVFLLDEFLLNGIENGVAKWEVLGISQSGREIDPLLQGFPVATAQHRRTKVRGNDLSIVSEVTGKGEGEIGCATADIEETRAGRYPTDGDCLLAPVVVQAKAQYRVKDIIMLGNRGKHLPHRVSHRLPLLLRSDIFLMDANRHIMGNDRSRAQLLDDLGRTPWLC